MSVFQPRCCGNAPANSATRPARHVIWRCSRRWRRTAPGRSRHGDRPPLRPDAQHGLCAGNRRTAICGRSVAADGVALVVTPNIDHIATIRRSPALARAYRQRRAHRLRWLAGAGLCAAGAVVASARVTGCEITAELMRLAPYPAWQRLFFVVDSRDDRSRPCRTGRLAIGCSLRRPRSRRSASSVTPRYCARLAGTIRDSWHDRADHGGRRAAQRNLRRYLPGVAAAVLGVLCRAGGEDRAWIGAACVLPMAVGRAWNGFGACCRNRRGWRNVTSEQRLASAPR